jgi:orotidine-5'-phosphate decarboxylase
VAEDGRTTGPGEPEAPGRADAGSDPDADRAGEPEAAGRGGGPEVVVALDVPGAAQARELVRLLPEGTWYKVGLELFTAEGPGLVRELAAAGHPVFLDLKLHDIPATVEGAVRSAADLGARLLTVHAAGGRPMLSAAARAARDAEGAGGRLDLLAVTVLTSLDDRLLSEVMGARSSAEEAVGRLAVLARDAGADGTVASVGECSAIKATCGEDFLVATPGIRLAGGEAHDQKRVATPAEAGRAGSDYLVVGRAVREADDPPAALRRIRAEAAEGAAAG